MPELPDLEVYVGCLRSRIVGESLLEARVASPSLLKTYDPHLSAVEGRVVAAVSRLGKQIVFEMERELYLVFHLMVMGRFAWRSDSPQDQDAGGSRRPGIRPGYLARFRFSSGVLTMTETGTKHRASLHVVAGAERITRFDRGGLDVVQAGFDEFREALCRENHTLKRALTDPRLLSGIGNAYSDEILHVSKLSPRKLTRQLTTEEVRRLHHASKRILSEWTAILREQVGDGFPRRVTAFQDGMRVHGKFGKPCPDCGKPVQRIVYAENESNYCPACQTDGRLLADRALSRLLKDDWPRTLSELEELYRARQDPTEN